MKKLWIGMVALLFVCSVSGRVLAAEGAYEPEEEPWEQNASYTMEEIAAMSSEELEVLELLPLNSDRLRVNSYYLLPSYSVRQSKTYYCGPAATLQLLKTAGLSSKITGSTDQAKQQTLASTSYLCTDRDGATWIGYVPTVMDQMTGRVRKWKTMKVNSSDSGTLNLLSYYTRSNLAYGNGVMFLVLPYKLRYYDPDEQSGHYISCSGIYYDSGSGTDFANTLFRLNDPHYEDRYFGEHKEPFMNVAEGMSAYSEQRGPDNFVY